MKLERDTEKNILVRDNNGEEIHPYITVLAAIEFQEKIIPPRLPEMSTQGWNVIATALKECIDNLGNPYKIVDTQVSIREDGTVSEVISVQPVEDTVPKTEEPSTIVDENHVSTSSAPATGKKPIQKR